MIKCMRICLVQNFIKTWNTIVPIYKLNMKSFIKLFAIQKLLKNN